MCSISRKRVCASPLGDSDNGSTSASDPLPPSSFPSVSHPTVSPSLHPFCPVICLQTPKMSSGWTAAGDHQHHLAAANAALLSFPFLHAGSPSNGFPSTTLFKTSMTTPPQCIPSHFLPVKSTRGTLRGTSMVLIQAHQHQGGHTGKTGAASLVMHAKASFSKRV